MDIFEDLRKTLGCNYISDLRLSRNLHMVFKAVANMKLEQYCSEQLADLAEYLTDTKIHFETKAQAVKFYEEYAG